MSQRARAPTPGRHQLNGEKYIKKSEAWEAVAKGKGKLWRTRLGRNSEARKGERSYGCEKSNRPRSEERGGGEEGRESKNKARYLHPVSNDRRPS